MLKLGQKMRDKVTGFTGIATARVEYLNGCVQFHIRPRAKRDGKFPSGVYFDQEQLGAVNGKVKVKRKETGGEMLDAPGGSYNG